MSERPTIDSPIFEDLKARQGGDPRGFAVRTYEEIKASVDRRPLKGKRTK